MQLPQNKHTTTFYKPTSFVEPPPPPWIQVIAASYLKHALNDWGDSRWQMAVLGTRTRDPGGPEYHPLMTICDI